VIGYRTRKRTLLGIYTYIVLTRVTIISTLSKYKRWGEGFQRLLRSLESRNKVNCD
jgi:hypothetical protein